MSKQTDKKLIAELLDQLIIAREFIKASQKDWQESIMEAESKQILQAAVDDLLLQMSAAIAKAEGCDE